MTDPKWPIGKATDTPEHDEAEAEVEGHALRGKAVEQPSDDPEAEVAGHLYKKAAVEQPDDADPDAGDTESLVRKN